MAVFRFSNIDKSKMWRSNYFGSCLYWFVLYSISNIFISGALADSSSSNNNGYTHAPLYLSMWQVSPLTLKEPKACGIGEFNQSFMPNKHSYNIRGSVKSVKVMDCSEHTENTSGTDVCYVKAYMGFQKSGVEGFNRKENPIRSNDYLKYWKSRDGYFKKSKEINSQFNNYRNVTSKDYKGRPTRIENKLIEKIDDFRESISYSLDVIEYTSQGLVINNYIRDAGTGNIVRLNYQSLKLDESGYVDEAVFTSYDSTNTCRVVEKKENSVIYEDNLSKDSHHLAKDVGRLFRNEIKTNKVGYINYFISEEYDSEGAPLGSWFKNEHFNYKYDIEGNWISRETVRTGSGFEGEHVYSFRDISYY